MSRGMQSYQRDRATLHVSHLEEFKAYIAGVMKFHILPKTAHPYEVFHVQEVDRCGDGQHSFIYRREGRHEHLTVQADLVPYVKKFLRARKKTKGRP